MSAMVPDLEALTNPPRLSPHSPFHPAPVTNHRSYNQRVLVILQSHDCDCSQVLSRFQGRCVDLVPFGRELESALSGRFQVKLERVSAQVRTPDLSAAYTVAEFMLNLLPLRRPVERGELEEYTQSHFAVPGGGFRLSVDQDFLTIRHRQGESS